jgi:hypothetical protein
MGAAQYGCGEGFGSRFPDRFGSGSMSFLAEMMVDQQRH